MKVRLTEPIVSTRYGLTLEKRNFIIPHLFHWLIKYGKMFRVWNM